MAFAPGDRVGAYEIVAPLGAGGMGEVWKARDPKLGRMVAIKVLREEEHGDLARLIQEARAAAQLNHPNIVTIHEIGEHDGRAFVVMEFIDGRVLNEFIGPSGLPLAEALKFAIPIVRALEAAHQAGIVHRDLKPNNVMVTATGDVKLLDFGLAKLIRPMEVVESGEATATLLDRPSTAKGLILGTIAYMSPEQAQGKPVDARTDIFSFGTLFYETLTGRRPFQGQNNLSTLAAILRDEPKPPGAAASIVLRCLRKDPESRFQTASDLRAALEGLQRQTPWRWWMATAGCIVLAAGALVAWLTLRTPKTIAPQTPVELTFDGGIAATSALSPDGKMLAFASDRAGSGNLDIWMRQTAGGSLLRLTSQPGVEYNPQFSPEGTRLYYLSGGQTIFEMPALGGPARKVADNAGPFSVSSKGEIVFARLGFATRPGPIFVIPSAGAAPEPWRPECKSLPRPAWSPDGLRIFFLGECGGKSRAGFIAPRRGGAAEAVLQAPSFGTFGIGPSPAWFQPARGGESIIYGWLKLLRFDLQGVPTPLLTGTGRVMWPAVSALGDVVYSETEQQTGILSLPVDSRGPAADASPASVVSAVGHFAVSRDGNTLVYGRLTGSNAGELVIRTLANGEEKVFAEHDLLGVAIGSIWPQLSPDGQRIVYRVVGKDAGHYLLRSDAGAVRRIATLEQFQLASDWSADGRRVLGECPGPRAGICEMDAETGAVKPLLVHALDQLLYPSWSWDGRAVAFMRRRVGGTAAIWIAPVTAAGAVAPEAAWVEISPPQTDNSRPRFSADGGMLYYVMGRDGERLLAAQRIDKASHRVTGDLLLPVREPVELTALTGGGGPYPLIAVSSKRLFYSKVGIRGNLWKTRVE